jgi:hypothetical protein
MDFASTLNFWDLHWIFYILGFLIFPRITTVVVFSTYVTEGFITFNLFLPLTIWLSTYASLGLSVLMKLGFSILFIAMPRLLLAIIGYMTLPQNESFMVACLIVGFILDGGVKMLSKLTKDKE